MVKEVVPLKGIAFLLPEEVFGKVKLKGILIVGTEQHHASHDDSHQTSHIGEELVYLIEGAVVGDGSAGLVIDELGV
jgi:hypothetical protein